MKAKNRLFISLFAICVLLLVQVTLVQGQDGNGQPVESDAESIMPRRSVAPIGTGFTYQGQLEESGGLANGDYDFQFTLYDSLTGGIQIGSMVTTTTTITDGLFTVVLDFGSNIFTGEARYLEIGVKPTSGGTYTILSPRQNLTPVPYALYGEDDDWEYNSGSGLTGDIYHRGNLALGTLTDPDLHGMNVQNYEYGRGAVRGVDQSGSSVYAEGMLGVLEPELTYPALPVDVYNIGVMGVNPDNGANAAGVYGWNYDHNLTNYGGVFVANGSDGGASDVNYGVYASASNAATNWAGYFAGNTYMTGTLEVEGQITMQAGAVAGYIPVADANGTMTWTDPAVLANDNDWAYFSGSGLTGEMYRSGDVALGSFTDPDGHGLNVQNYSSGKAAVRGADQSSGSLYAEGMLGVLSPGVLGVPRSVTNAGVLGIKPANGGNGAAVYGWNNDINSENFAGIFIADGAGTTNYGVYGQALNGTTNNYAGFFNGTTIVENGRVGIGINTPNADIHLVQSNATDAGAGGMMFQWVTDNWKIYHSGLHLSFAENGTRRAYVQAGTGAYVQVSDAASKTDVTDLGSVLDDVMLLRPVEYLYLGQPEDAAKSTGFIAQEVGEVFPELMRTNEQGQHGLAYSDFSVLAIAAIQEQQGEIEALREVNAQLQSENEQLRQDIADIKEYIGMEQGSASNTTSPVHILGFVALGIAGMVIFRQKQQKEVS